MTPPPKPSVVGELFVQFYELLCHLKSLVEGPNWEINKERIFIEKLGPISPEQFVSDEIIDLLRRQEREIAEQYGVVAAELFKESEYLMSALADEIFLTIDWPGLGNWKNHLIEEALFRTHCAGERVFQRLDEILKNRQAIGSELVGVYLRFFAAGFEGELRGKKDGARILADYRSRLYALAWGGPPDVHAPGWRHTSPAYTNTFSGGETHLLPSRRQWFIAPAAILALGLIISSALWYPLKNSLQKLSVNQAHPGEYSR